MKSINVTIDGNVYEVPEDSTVLNAAWLAGINIPNLCHSKYLDSRENASCRLCVVEVEGRKNLAASCATPVVKDMVIYTHSPRVIKTRKMLLELMIASHPQDCMTCENAGNCKLQDYCYEYEVKTSRFAGGEERTFNYDDSNEFYIYNPDKCILCSKCVRVCESLQGTTAITYSLRGFNTHVSAEFERPLKNSICVSCGNCVEACPSGALMPKSKVKYRSWEITKTKTTCTYCGVGCQMNLLVKDKRVVGVKSAPGLANNGLLCVKGRFAYNFVNHPDRLKTPLIKVDGEFRESTWEEALNLIASKIQTVKQEHSSDALAGFSSARCTNEENYIFQKLFRAVIGTNNIDHCARLCHASTVSGLAATLGSGAMTNSNLEVIDSEVIFITGSNTTETHPVIGSFIKQAKIKGAKVIVAEPRNIELAQTADIFLQIKPGTNVALYNGLMHVIIREGLQDRNYISSLTENYEELERLVNDYTPEEVGKICGVNPQDIEKAAIMYAKAATAGIYYAMGVTQHSTGTHGVMSLSNLALLCGNIGKENCGVNPLRGQNNVQGACDMGALPGDLPGYQKVFDPVSREKFQKLWGAILPEKAGYTITEVMDRCSDGRIKLLYIMGENPMISDPDINHVQKALENCEFLVVQDIFMTETAQFADVVLPAATFAEKDGTFTNTERRVQRVRKAIEPTGQSRTDSDILIELMGKLGYTQANTTASDIMDEIAACTPQYAGINYSRIEDEGLQWPVPDLTHPGTKFLHREKFPRGKALFKAVDYAPSSEETDSDYPYILTTGRILYQYHTRTMTDKTEGLTNISGTSYIEINPVTASRLDVEDGEYINVISRRGDVNTQVKVTDIVSEDVLFMPFHFADGAANLLTNTALDPYAKIPELKVCAVRVEKIPHERKIK